MAGIGFELRKVFRKNSIISTLQGVVYASAVTVGPVVLVISTLLLMYGIFQFSDLSYVNREVLSSTILYIFVFGHILISLFDSMISRSIADAVYANGKERILTIYRAGLFLLLPIGAAIGLFFGWQMMAVANLSLSYVLAAYLLFLSLLLVFYAMTFISAIKEYKYVAAAYLLGMLLAVATALLLIYVLQVEATQAVLYSFCVGFMFIAIVLHAIVRRFFHDDGGEYRAVFQEFWKNKSLSVINLFYILGLYISNFVIWNSDLRVNVAKIFVSAPSYDMATCLAMFTNISAMVIFVVQVETNFHERYQHFCEMIIGGSKKAIDTAKGLVFRTLWQQVLYMAELQLIITVILFLLGKLFLPALGFGGLTLTFYPTLTVAFYMVFLMYAAVVSLFYFDDKAGALATTLSFFLGSILATLGLVFYGQRPEFYGLGMLIGSLIGWTVAYLRIRYLERNLDSFIFCKGKLISSQKGEMPKNLIYRKD